MVFRSLDALLDVEIVPEWRISSTDIAVAAFSKRVALEIIRTETSPGNRKERPAMMTQGEIEAAVSQGIARFEQEYMGRGPKDIQTYLLGDLLVVRLRGVLTAAEQQLVKTVQPEKGRDLLKQVRTQLIELARPLLEGMVNALTGVKVLSLHHDISTSTGEEIVVFTLSEVPVFRELKHK